MSWPWLSLFPFSDCKTLKFPNTFPIGMVKQARNTWAANMRREENSKIFAWRSQGWSWGCIQSCILTVHGNCLHGYRLQAQWDGVTGPAPVTSRPAESKESVWLYLKMISFIEFRGLSPDEKNNEILKLLPLLVPLKDDFAGLKHSINLAIDRITKLEYDYGIFCPKTRSVDDMLEPPNNNSIATPNQFNSVDNIYKTSSVSSRLRSRTELHLSGVSSFTQPLPDISGNLERFFY